MKRHKLLHIACDWLRQYLKYLARHQIERIPGLAQNLSKISASVHVKFNVGNDNVYESYLADMKILTRFIIKVQ